METEEEDYLHEPANSRKELSSVYRAFRDNDDPHELANLSKKDIIDRIVDGDWRRGLSYHQLASIDFARLEEDDTSLRWTALKLVPLQHDECAHQQQRPLKKPRLEQPRSTALPHYPDTTIGIFVQNLKRHISPVVKAHYHIHRMESWGASVVRLQIQENAPFAPLSANMPRQGRAATENSRCVYVALPDSCPYVYVSLAGSDGVTGQKDRSKNAGTKTDLATMKKVILEAIPKALSRPQQRWSLEPTKLTAKSLRAMCMLRGSGKVGTTGGAFSQLTRAVTRPDRARSRDDVQDGGRTPSIPISTALDEDTNTIIESRFGHMTGASHVGLDRLNVKVGNILQGSGAKSKKRKRIDDDDYQEAAPMTITLCGYDVFAGLKQLALAHPEYVDMEKLSTIFSGGSHCSVITI